MDTLKAFELGQASRYNEKKVFDWDRAAELIKESGFKDASAGLQGDWEWTGGVIFIGGKPYLDGYTYLSSTWATPEIEIDGMTQPCYKMQSEVPGWDSGTKWPDSALTILKGELAWKG